MEGSAERAGSRDRVLVVACGALAREIRALCRLNRWDHIDLECLPAQWHLTPEKIVPGVEERVERARGRYARIFVAYADCGTGGELARACARLGVEMIQGPHCYSFYEGNDRFAEIAENEISAFYLTDFLVRQFDAFFWKPMGLDRHPELRDIYFGNYTKLVYQSQTEDPALLAKARDCAERMGLAFEHRHTGYGDLESTLTRVAANVEN